MGMFDDDGLGPPATPPIGAPPPIVAPWDAMPPAPAPIDAEPLPPGVPADVWPPQHWGFVPPPPMSPPPMGAAGFGPIPESALQAPGAPSAPAPPQLQHELGAGPAGPGPGQLDVGVMPGPKAPPMPEEQMAAGPMAPAPQLEGQAKQEADIDREAQALAADPKALARKQMIAAQAYADQQTALQAQAIADDRKRAEANRTMYVNASVKAQADTDKLVAESTALANTKIDPDLHQGVLGSIGSFIGLALGGAMSQYTGGRNLALDQFNKAIDNHIAAQRDNIANRWRGLGVKREAIADSFSRSGDMYRAEETFRVGAYQRAQNEIATKMQQFDPRGTVARQLGQQYQAIDAAKAQAVAAFQQQQFGNQLKIEEVSQKQQAQILEQRNKDLDRDQREKDSSRSAWVTTRGQDLTDARARDEFELKRQDKIDAKAEKQGDGTIGGIPEAVDAQGAVKFGTLKNADGSSFVIKDKEAHKDLSKMVAASFDVNRLSNQLAREISEWGGQSDTIKGAKWQKIKSDQEALVFALHQAEGIEGFRPGTAEMLEKLTGDVDPTSYIRTATPGILRARDNVNAAVDNQLRVRAGYTGKAFAPADTSSLPEPSKDDIDTMHKALQTDPMHTSWESLSPDDRDFVARGKARGLALADPNTLSDEQRAELSDVPPILVRAWRSGWAPSQLQAWDDLGLLLESDNKAKRERATAVMNDLATNGPNQMTRQIAAQALTGQAVKDVPTGNALEETEPATSSAKEDKPPPPKGKK